MFLCPLFFLSSTMAPSPPSPNFPSENVRMVQHSSGQKWNFANKQPPQGILEQWHCWNCLCVYWELTWTSQQNSRRWKKKNLFLFSFSFWFSFPFCFEGGSFRRNGCILVWCKVFRRETIMYIPLAGRDGFFFFLFLLLLFIYKTFPLS